MTTIRIRLQTCFEFVDVDREQPNAVVVGDAADVFTYRTLNEAFRILMDGGALIAMGNNRYFREQDGLSLDMGPFVEALRFASGVEPTVIGKPSAIFLSMRWTTWESLLRER